jgi:WXG100 family type VII secretion target
MANIVYRFEEMRSAAEEIDGYVEDYKSAAQTLQSALDTATANWEGDSKTKFKTYIDGPIYTHLHDKVPEILAIIAAEIRASADNMERTDSEVASGIPSSLS